MGQYTKEMFERDLKARREQEAKQEEECRERQERESLLRAWKADGGSEADFEREWPKLREEGRRRRVVDADRRARETMQASGVSSI